MYTKYNNTYFYNKNIIIQNLSSNMENSKTTKIVAQCNTHIIFHYNKVLYLYIYKVQCHFIFYICAVQTVLSNKHYKRHG